MMDQQLPPSQKGSCTKLMQSVHHEASSKGTGRHGGSGRASSHEVRQMKEALMKAEEGWRSALNVAQALQQKLRDVQTEASAKDEEIEALKDRHVQTINQEEILQERLKHATASKDFAAGLLNDLNIKLADALTQRDALEERVRELESQGKQGHEEGAEQDPDPPPPHDDGPSDEVERLHSQLDEAEMLRTHSDKMWQDAEAEAATLRHEVEAVQREGNIRRVLLVAALSEVEQRVASMKKAVLRALVAVDADQDQSHPVQQEEEGDGEGEDVIESLQDVDLVSLLRRILQHIDAVEAGVPSREPPVPDDRHKAIAFSFEEGRWLTAEEGEKGPERGRTNANTNGHVGGWSSIQAQDGSWHPRPRPIEIPADHDYDKDSMDGDSYRMSDEREMADGDSLLDIDGANEARHDHVPPVQAPDPTPITTVPAHSSPSQPSPPISQPIPPPAGTTTPVMPNEEGSDNTKDGRSNEGGGAPSSGGAMAQERLDKEKAAAFFRLFMDHMLRRAGEEFYELYKAREDLLSGDNSPLTLTATRKRKAGDEEPSRSLGSASFSSPPSAAGNPTTSTESVTSLSHASETNTQQTITPPRRAVKFVVVPSGSGSSSRNDRNMVGEKVISLGGRNKEHGYDRASAATASSARRSRFVPTTTRQALSSRIGGKVKRGTGQATVDGATCQCRARQGQREVLMAYLLDDVNPIPPHPRKTSRAASAKKATNRGGRKKAVGYKTNGNNHRCTTTTTTTTTSHYHRQCAGCA